MRFDDYMKNIQFESNAWPLHHRIGKKEYVPIDVIGNFVQVN
jgi:hypothetical protein